MEGLGYCYFHLLCLPSFRSMVERRVFIDVSGHDVSIPMQKLPHHLQVSVLGRSVQWHHVREVVHVHELPGLSIANEHCDHFDLVLLGCVKEGAPLPLEKPFYDGKNEI